MDAAVSVELFVEILNRYVYYFDQENEAVRHLCKLQCAAGFLPWVILCIEREMLIYIRSQQSI